MFVTPGGILLAIWEWAEEAPCSVSKSWHTSSYCVCPYGNVEALFSCFQIHEKIKGGKETQKNYIFI